MKAPPYAVAQEIADEYDLDQVIVIGRKGGDDGFETITTYGRSDDDARVCDMIGTHITKDIMKWGTDHRDEMAERVRLGRAVKPTLEAIAGSPHGPQCDGAGAKALKFKCTCHVRMAKEVLE